MYPSLFIHSSIERHLGCFQFGATVNKAAINISMKFFLCEMLLIIWGALRTWLWPLITHIFRSSMRNTIHRLQLHGGGSEVLRESIPLAERILLQTHPMALTTQHTDSLPVPVPAYVERAH